MADVPLTSSRLPWRSWISLPVNGVCPIPRCAHEVWTSFLGVSLGAGLLLTENDLSFLTAYPFHARAVLVFWGFVLLNLGILQVIVLLALSNRFLHRWTAFLGFLVGLALGGTLLEVNHSVPAFFGALVCYVLAEGYIFLMLKGAKWSG